ncbi:MAG: T9SS type A sorting domain-containing protein [Bacteroidota bacterium]|jgi:hypothetical protein
MKNLTLLICLLLYSLATFSTHISGGEVGYECIGPRTWKVTLTLYKDCGGIPLCSNSSCQQTMTARPNTTLNPAGCSATPNQVNFNVSLIKVQDIGLASIAVCGNSAKNGCTNMGAVQPGTNNPSTELYVFEGTLNLNLPSLNVANTCSYWDIYWEVCCRNAGIANIISSSSTGIRIGATINIFWQSGSGCKNSSPIFKNEPVAAACSGELASISLGAIDPDFDSLSFEIGPAYNNGGQSVIYQTPFSATYPFPLNSALPPHSNYPQPNGPFIVIDSAKGDISFRPINNNPNNLLGVINIIVKQWATNSNGVPILVGLTQREVQLQIFNCLSNYPPRFTTSPSLPFGQPKTNYVIASGDQLCFTITAKDSDVYPNIPRFDTTFITWNEGIVRPGKLSFVPTYTITSSLPRPREDSWQFCWQTDTSDERAKPYYFTVNALDNRCPNPGRVQTTFSILVSPKLEFRINQRNLGCGSHQILVYKHPSFRRLSSGSIKIAQKANDVNFLFGSRVVAPIDINPIQQPQDSVGQPRLMFIDSFRYESAGKYYIRFEYQIEGSSVLFTAMDSIEVNTADIFKPTILAKTDTNICEGNHVLLEVGFNKPAYKYQWVRNNSPIFNANQFNHIDSVTGVYSLLISDTLLGCTNFTNVIRVVVKPNPEVISTTPGVRCGGGNLLLKATPNSGTIRWYVNLTGGGVIATGEEINITNLNNTKTFYAEAFALGCKSPIRVPVLATIASLPIVDTIFGSSMALIPGTNYTYKVNALNDHNYLWTIENGVIIGSQTLDSVVVNWISPGQGKVSVNVTNINNCADSANLSVSIINPLPVVLSFTPTTAKTGDTISITGNYFNSTTQVMFGGVQARNFTVLSNTSIAAIVDTGATGDVMVTTPSGNASLAGFIFQKNTGLNESLLDNVVVFPNPVTDQLQIELNSVTSAIKIEVRDIAGKLILSDNIPSGSKTRMIDLNDLTPSVYLLHLSSSNSSKIIKLIKY